jgi:hypothetical protein
MDSRDTWIIDRAKKLHGRGGMSKKDAINQASNEYDQLNGRTMNPAQGQQFMAQSLNQASGTVGGRYAHQQVELGFTTTKPKEEKQMALYVHVRCTGNDDTMEIGLATNRGLRSVSEEIVRRLVGSLKDPDSSIEYVKVIDSQTDEVKEHTRFKPGALRW